MSSPHKDSGDDVDGRTGFTYAPLEVERDDPTRSMSCVEADRANLRRRASSLDRSEQLRGGAHMASGGYDPEKKVRNLWDRYQHSLEVTPLRTKCLTSGLIAMAGDIMGQYFTRSSLVPFTLDTKRLVIYAITGLTFAPVVVHYWFGLLQRFEQKTGIKNRYGRALAALALDQTVGSVTINAGFFVFFMLLKSAADGNALDVGATASAVSRKLSNEMYPTLIANWKLWPIANYINFCFVPFHLRVLFSNVVAVFWSIYLSNAAAK